MINLKIQQRSIIGKGVRSLRTKNIIPGVIYGHDISSQNIEIDKNLFKKVFAEAGESTIIELQLDEKKPLKVLIQNIQFDPITNEIIHVDFYQIKEKEKVSVEIELNFVGEALVVKEKGGILVHNLSKLKIEALPKDLIHEAEVNVSNLKEFSDLIRVKDIKISSNIKVLHEPEEVVVSVSSPRQEEVAPITEEKTGEVEVVKGKEDKEEEKEGAALEEKKSEEK